MFRLFCYGQEIVKNDLTLESYTMKICYILTRSDAIGGVQIHVRNFSKMMNEKMHNAHILVGGKGSYFQHLVDEGHNVQSIKFLRKNINPIYDLLALFEIIILLKKIKPEIVSTHSSKAGVLGRLASKLLGIPVIFTAHGWAFTEGVGRAKQIFYSKIETLMSIMTDHIITVSDYDLDLALEKKITEKYRIQSIHNGMPEIAKKFISEISSDRIKICMVARFDAQKDHVTLLTSLAEIKDLSWDIDFLGDGPLVDSVKRYTEQLGIEDRVNFFGQVSDVKIFLRESQIFALISNWEGLPRSIIEAMRSGLPIVASDVAGVKELIDDGINGYLIPRKDSKTLSKRMRSLIIDEELRMKMAKESIKKYQEGFTLDRTFDKTFAVYKETIEINKENSNG